MNKKMTKLETWMRDNNLLSKSCAEETFVMQEPFPLKPGVKKIISEALYALRFNNFNKAETKHLQAFLEYLWKVVSRGVITAVSSGQQ